jgi:hypothetical protein
MLPQLKRSRPGSGSVTDVPNGSGARGAIALYLVGSALERKYFRRCGFANGNYR